MITANEIKAAVEEHTGVGCRPSHVSYRDADKWIYAPPVQSLTRNGRLHPNEKPVHLFARHLLPKCPPGVVLDPFCGSGSCGVAALRLGLPYVGIEIDPSWAAVARERLAAEEAGSTLTARRAGQIAMFGGER